MEINYNECLGILNNAHGKPSPMGGSSSAVIAQKTKKLFEMFGLGR